MINSSHTPSVDLLAEEETWRLKRVDESINNDIVIEGKKRVAIMEGHSSLWARNRHLDTGTTFEAATGLQLPGHAPFGGAVPLVTVDGDHRGWVIVSGLTQEEDHELAVQGIRAVQRSESGPPDHDETS